MSWDDWMSWVMFSVPLSGEGDPSERDSWRSHPAKAIVLMLIFVLLLGAIGGVVWLIG